MSLILKALMSTQWAILPGQLELMTAIANRDDLKALGFDEGRPMEHARTPAEVVGSVAVVSVTGPIFRRANLFTQMCGATSTECLVKDLITAADNPKVNNIVLDFDTPGGEAKSINEAAEYIAMIQQTTGKKITAYVDGAACSAGYWLASACAEIVISKTGQVGSIGAVVQFKKTHDDTIGEIVSSRAPNKRPDLSTEAGQLQIQAMLDDMQDVFIESAAAGRGMTAEALIAAGNDGGVVMGAKAVTAGLADRTGNLKSLLDELNAAKPGAKKRATPNHKPTMKGHQMAATIEELKAENPALVAELETTALSTGEATGVEKERARVAAILSAESLGHDDLKQKALLNGDDAGVFALAVIGAEKSKKAQVLTDAENADVTKVTQTDPLEDKGPVKLTSKELKTIATAYVAEQAQAGKTVLFADAVKLASKGEI